MDGFCLLRRACPTQKNRVLILWYTRYSYVSVMASAERVLFSTLPSRDADADRLHGKKLVVQRKRGLLLVPEKTRNTVRILYVHNESL